MKNSITSILQLFLPLVGGILIGFLTMSSMDYPTLNKPPLSPPGVIFPIVWTILYLIMGISYFLLKRDKDTEKESIIYYVQLFINYLWSIFFFGLQWRLFSIFWIFLLDSAVIYMIYLFYSKKKICAFLNIPYLIWILFATYLTIGIYFLN